MEPQTHLDQGLASDFFFDAPDQLPPPESEENPGTSAASGLRPAADEACVGIGPAAQSPQSSPVPIASIRRRRASFRSAAARGNPAEFRGSTCDSSEISNPWERRRKGLVAGKGHVRGGADSASSGVTSEVAVAEDGRRDIGVAQAESSCRDVELSADSTSVNGSPQSSSGLLVSIAGFIIKAIGFQISLLVGTVTFPLRLLHFSFLLLTDPLRPLKRGRDYVWRTLMWVVAVLSDRIGPFVFERLSSQRGVGKWVLRVALGCFWSFYVCMTLLLCLASAFLIGRLLMGSVVEKPLRFTEELSFDYTETSPVAVVPILPCHALECGLGCSKNLGVGKWDGQRLIPPNHKLQLTVSLTLPESDYNQKLGIFQVKVEFLSANGKIVASSSRPCMLQFKSPPIRFLEAFFKSGPLLAGYASESQVISLNMRGFTEGTEPTACIRIILKRRAGYRPGAGVPEIYAAYIRLESELPLLKKFIWNWRRTLFIWISIGLFISELLFILVCCAPLIIPRSRQRSMPLAERNS